MMLRFNCPDCNRPFIFPFGEERPDGNIGVECPSCKYMLTVDMLPDYFRFDEMAGDWFKNELDSFRKSGNYTGLSLRFGNGGTPNALDALAMLFDEIPDSQKYSVVLDIYTNLKSPSKRMTKYITAIKPLIPTNIIEPIKHLADGDGYLTVYRGGVQVKNPALCQSWTLSEKTAEWFAKRFLFIGDTVMYRGQIKLSDVIAYDNGREEQEIVQYRSIKRVEVVKNYYKADWVTPGH